jgi:hypothetical protein
MKKMKINAGRNRSAMMLLRLRLRFLIAKVAPVTPLCSLQDKL